MRDRTRFALKQAATIFLLITTLVLRVVPEELLAAPRTLLMDGVCTAASPLYFLSGLFFETPQALFSRGKSREALELEVMKLTAQLAARDDELRRAREQLAALRTSRDRAPVDATLADMLKAAENGDNLMPHFIACVKAEATLGEICNALRGLWGEYQPPVWA